MPWLAAVTWKEGTLSRTIAMFAVAATLAVVPAALAEDSPTPLATPFPPAPPTVTADGKDGFTIRSGDGNNRVRITGYGHADGRFFGDDEVGATDAFLLRRLRPVVSGTLAGRFEFSFMPDFGGGTAVVQDGWLDTRFLRWLRLRIGKMKAPFGVERLQSATSILFIERTADRPGPEPRHRHPAPRRSGRRTSRRLLQRRGGRRLRRDRHQRRQGPRGPGVRPPFRANAGSPLNGLGLGFAASTGRQSGNLATYRSDGQLAVYTFATGVTADGVRRRWSPQATFTGGPVRLLFEHVRSTHRVRKAPRLEDVGLGSWQLAGGVLVTGEKNGWGSVDPKDPFAPRRAGKGAIELVGRYGRMTVDDEAFDLGFADPAAASEARELAFGVNWWLTRFVKYVANYSRTTFEGGAAAGADRPAENALLMRVQVAF